MKTFGISHRYKKGKAILSRQAFVFLMIALSSLNIFAPILGLNHVSAQVDIKSLLDLHNAERLQAGLNPLKISSELTASANQKASAMLAADCWSHYCPEGKSPWEFFAAAGYDYLYAGENLAEGFYNNSEVMKAWINSPTHKANILGDKFDEVGFGFARGAFQNNPDNIVIVVHFGSRSLEALGGQKVSGAPTIVSPVDGSFINQTYVDVFGKTTASSVKLHLTPGASYNVPASEGAFTQSIKGLSDGKYSLVAENANVTPGQLSSVVGFTIDTKADTVTESDFTIWQRSGDRVLQINKSDIGSITLSDGQSNLSMIASKDGIWEAIINNLTKEELNVKFSDKAGNISSFKLDLEKITVLEDSNAGGSGFSTINIINALAIGLILFFLASDVYFLSKYRQNHETSHMHIGALAALVLTVIINSASGSILTAIGI